MKTLDRPFTSKLQRKRVLIVDNEQYFGDDIVETLRRREFDVVVARSTAESLTAIKTLELDVALLNLAFHSPQALALIRQMREIRPTTRFIVTADTDDVDHVVAAFKEGAFDFLRKPTDISSLFSAIDHAFEHQQLEKEKKAAESALRLSEARMRDILETAADGIITIDDHCIITTCNPATERLFGYTTSEIVGGPASKLLPELFATEVETRKQSSASFVRCPGCEVTGVRKDGSTIPLELNISESWRDGRLLLIGILRDISDRKRAEEEQVQLETRLRQSQKMEALGQLAGGIAHDFNNILTAISGNAELLTDCVEPDDKKHDFIHGAVEQIERASQRAASLTRQLLAFSRRQVITHRSLNLNSVLIDTEDMLRRLISEQIKLELILSPEIAPILADQGQMEQVILNLAVNARDAMPDGGTLTIETACYDGEVDGLGAGQYVVLHVRDTGVGMDSETVERVFEPFFTTKEMGEGTGLGLSTVHGIVEQCGGKVVVESRPAAGSSFRAYFAAHKCEDDDSSDADASSGEMPKGDETVLVCEDDTSVRELTARIVRSAGYRVLTASDGQEGLEVSRKFGGTIDLLVTDIIMPELDGRKLARHLMAERPNTRVLFVSGYTPSVISRHGVFEAGAEFLEKPFDRSNLLKRIRMLLDHSVVSN